MTRVTCHDIHHLRIHSVSLHSHRDIVPDLRLTRVTDDGQVTDIVSGYIREFQPTRRLVTPQVMQYIKNV